MFLLIFLDIDFTLPIGPRNIAQMVKREGPIIPEGDKSELFVDKIPRLLKGEAALRAAVEGALLLFRLVGALGRTPVRVGGRHLQLDYIPHPLQLGDPVRQHCLPGGADHLAGEVATADQEPHRAGGETTCED